jgi:8-oxo-dGTP pyrophosphatase MutT (NUDIX family)
MVQRKDSLCFVEFVRGKYSLQNRMYLLRLLSNMTPGERASIECKNFDALWNGFWQTDHNRTFIKEFEQSRCKFSMLVHGYCLRPVGGSAGNLIQVSLDGLLAATSSARDGPEYGFPKGRRNINESDMRCACREFREETSMRAHDIHLLQGVVPFEEVFTGSNKVRYRHVYYVAVLAACSDRVVHDGLNVRALLGGHDVEVTDAVQRREVRALGWFNSSGVHTRLGPDSVERHHMFSHLHAWVMGNLLRVMASASTPASPHELDLSRL